MLHKAISIFWGLSMFMSFGAVFVLGMAGKSDLAEIAFIIFSLSLLTFSVLIKR